MGKKSKIGKVVLNHKGYSIRHLIKAKTGEKSKQTTYLNTGKFGIYTGKKLLLEVSKPEEAIPLIEMEIRDNKKEKEIALQAYIRKMKLVNSLTRRTWD